MRILVLMAVAVLTAAPVTAQFSGPSETGAAATVAQAKETRLGQYVTLTGNIVSHMRGDYYKFRDATGEIRVEVGSNLWQERDVSPETEVRIVGEIDRGFAGRYLWVKSLDILN